MKLKSGDKAPAFAVKNQDGKIIKLSDLKGKKVVLYFYPKDNTPGCTLESCNLRDNYKVLQKKGYEVLGVSTDSEKSHQNFIKKQELPFDLLADVNKSAHEAYGTWVEKSMYGRKYMGTARVTFIINEKGIIEEIIEKVDFKNHTEQILADPSVKKEPKKTVAPKVKTSAKKMTAKRPAVKKNSVKKKK